VKNYWFKQKLQRYKHGVYLYVYCILVMHFASCDTLWILYGISTDAVV